MAARLGRCRDIRTMPRHAGIRLTRIVGGGRMVLKVPAAPKVASPEAANAAGHP